MAGCRRLSKKEYQKRCRVYRILHMIAVVCVTLYLNNCVDNIIIKARMLLHLKLFLVQLQVQLLPSPNYYHYNNIIQHLNDPIII